MTDAPAVKCKLYTTKLNGMIVHQSVTPCPPHEEDVKKCAKCIHPCPVHPAP